MPPRPLLLRTSKLLALSVGVYAVFIGLIATPFFQRHALYLHAFHTAWWHSPLTPELSGFPKGQVTPLVLNTEDKEHLFAWHILPFELYAQHERELLNGEVDALTLLKRPESRLVINFHGNAGHVVQGHRDPALKMLSLGAGPNTHILTFDYHGFGHSTGTPAEDALILDGVAAVNWALRTAKLPASQIVFLGHSLGTAVATATYEIFALENSSLFDFRGLVLVSGFTDLPSLLKTYRLGGFMPILSPLKYFPSLQAWVSRALVDTWDTAGRLRRILDDGPLRLHILHGTKDRDIDPKHADMLFNAATEGRPKSKGSTKDAPEQPKQILDGTWERKWQDGKGRAVTRTVFEHGRHNTVSTYPYLALVIRKLLYD